MTSTFVLPRARQTAVTASPSKAARLALALVGVASIVAAVAAQRFPAAGTTEFSASRVQEHLRAIASTARPIGSAGHAQARQYLVDRLRGLGAATEVQTAVVQRQWLAARVANVIGRLEGTAHGAPVVLVAHYDTIPGSAGATDDGLGVAVALEVMTVLSRHRPAHDVIALFTDGEEAGILGAHAAASYLKQNVARVAGIINMEGRGNAGPAVLFQTNVPNGRAVAWLAQANAAFRTSSVFSDLYRLLPYGTDLSSLATADRPSLNVAFIGRPEVYHTAADNVGALDWSSVPELGDAVLKLAAHPMDAAAGGAGEQRTYFDLFGRTIISYPARWSVVLAIALALGWILAVAFVVARKRSNATAVLIGCGLAIVVILVPAAAGYVSATARRLPWRGEWVPWVLLAGGISWLVCSVAARRRTGDLMALWLGCAASLVVAASSLGFLLPASAYAVQVPCVALLILAASARFEPRAALALHIACTAGVAAIVVPVLVWLWIGLGALAPPVLAAACSMLALAAAPTWWWATADSRWPTRVAMTCVVASAAALVAAVWIPRAGEAAPRMFVAAPQTREAGWVAFPRVGTAAFRTAVPVGSRYPALDSFGVFTTAAATVPLAPVAEVVADHRAGDDRVLELRLRSLRGAPILHVWLDPAGVQAASLEGQSFDVRHLDQLAQQGRWLRFVGAERDGVTLLVRAQAGGGVRLRLADQSYDLPPDAARSQAMAAGWNSDATVVAGEYRW